MVKSIKDWRFFSVDEYIPRECSWKHFNLIMKTFKLCVQLDTIQPEQSTINYDNFVEFMFRVARGEIIHVDKEVIESVIGRPMSARLKRNDENGETGIFTTGS